MCCEPDLTAINFYDEESDKTLGEFLLSNVKEAMLQCDPQKAPRCKRTKRRHILALSHDSSRIIVMRRKLDQSSMPVTNL